MARSRWIRSAEGVVLLRPDADVAFGNRIG
jgi:hypothetical protein